jgi:Holliday junction DNA helicase RuvA
MESHPRYLVLEWMGLGLQVLIPASLYFKTPETGETMTVFTYLHVKDDGINLYGFLSKQERDFFKTILRVSGIGPKVALSLMGHLTLSQLYQAIYREETEILTNVPGIGKKTAGRLIYELKGILDFSKEESLSLNNEELKVWNDVEQALLSLGYSLAEITKVKNQLEGMVELPMEALFKKALGLLGKY